jgi:hypothetical protein
VQQLRVVVEPGLGEQVADGGAALLVAGAAPDRAVGLVQSGRQGGQVDGFVGGLHDGLSESQGLLMEVHVVPARQGAAPVEDHRVHRHAGQPNRTLAR